MHGPLPPGESRLEVITKIITALREGRLPPTYGFINAVHLERQPEHAAVLDAWGTAGNSIDLSSPAEPDMLEEARKARHLAVPERTDFALQLEAVCR